MDTAIIVALITAAATVIAAAIAILPRVLRKELVNSLPGSSSSACEGGASNTRRVYFQGAQYRFLNFGGRNCRIEPVEGGQSFLAPTHELFYDAEQTRRISRDSIVVRT